MLTHPQFDPVAVSIGPIAIHWYGLMYLIGFFLVWILGRSRAGHPDSLMDRKSLEDLLFYSMLGVVIDRKSTRLNSSHVAISYAVFCLQINNTTTKDQTYS